MIVKFKSYLKLFENDSNNQKITFYNVYISSNLSNDIIEYYGVNYEKAKKEYDSITENNINRKNCGKYESPIVVFDKIIKTFKFVYILPEDETIDDYDILDYYDDENYYIEINNTVEILDSNTFRSENEIEESKNAEEGLIFDDIRKNIITYVKNKYEKYIHYTEKAGLRFESFYIVLLLDINTKKLVDNINGELYNVSVNYRNSDTITFDGSIVNREYKNRDVIFDETKYQPIQIRISNHSQNISNINDNIYKSISLVVNNVKIKVKDDIKTNDVNNKEYIYTNNDDDIFDECTEIINDFINEIE